MPDGTDGDRHSGGGIGGRQHVAAAIEDPAWIDDHARGMHFAGHDALGLDLDAALGEDYAIEAAGDHYAVSFNLALNFGAFTEDYGLLRNDITSDVAVDAERAGDLQRAFQRNALIDEAGPLFVAATARTTGPLPSHEIPQTKTLPL